MKLKLTIKNKLVQSGMKASLSKLVKSNLGKYALHIRKVDIRVDDVSTHQHGTLKECSINMLLPGLPSVVVKRKGKNILHSIQRALASLQDVYPSHLKMRVSVGVKSDLGKALIASNSGSIIKINNAV